MAASGFAEMDHLSLPSQHGLFGIPGYLLTLLLLLVSLAVFSFIIYKRLLLLKSGKADPRTDRICRRLLNALLNAVFQRRQPRYRIAGLLHIIIFFGFVALSFRSLSLIGLGLSPAFRLPFIGGSDAEPYNIFKDWVGLLVLVACLVAAIRRAAFRPQRYQYPGGKGHGGEAYIILALIAALMVTDMFFDGAEIAFQGGASGPMAGSLLASYILEGMSAASLDRVHLWSYWLHLVILLSFLCYLPLSKHFHVITAIPNVFAAKMRQGSIKPADWKVQDLDQIDTMGIGRFEDLTWKHILDLVSCADCGRCSDHCPAATVGRPLSPRMITIKARDHGYRKYPILGGPKTTEADAEFLGGIITEEEIWSCTTCGACERECPIFIEYIDKIVDMRRFLIDEGRVPKTLRKPLMDIQTKGNPYGGPDRKRAQWTEELGDGRIRILQEGDEAEFLYFVDSCSSFDPRIQQIARAFSRIMAAASVDFGILGPFETDSGHDVRRIGEEGLFQELAQKNTGALKKRRFKEIVTTDPHAYNAIKNDYPERFAVLHYTELLLRLAQDGRIRFPQQPTENRVYTFHDPCYLGRHNGLYDVPRRLLRKIPGIRLLEMERSRDRSFCCGGGGLMLWYEAETETIRMGQKRVEMARKAEADVILTACPFCLINLEDAVKTSGLEDALVVVDVAELVARRLFGEDHNP